MEQNPLRAHKCSLKCFRVFAMWMACLCWWIFVPPVLAADGSCRKISPAVPLSLGSGTSKGLWCDFECDAPAGSGNISAGLMTNHSMREKPAISDRLHPSVPSSLYPYLRCSSDSGTAGEVELNLHSNSTWKHRRILVMNFAALKLTAVPFHSLPKVLEVLQFENVGRLDLSSLDLVAPSLSLEIRHSSVIFSQSSWNVSIRSLTMFNVSAHVLPLIMLKSVEKVSIAEGTFNSTSCLSERHYGNPSKFAFGESSIYILDSRIKTMEGCRYPLPIRIKNILLTRVEIGQVEGGCLAGFSAFIVVFKACKINRLQDYAFEGLDVDYNFRLEENFVGRVDSFVLSRSFRGRYVRIDLLGNTFGEVSNSTAFLVRPSVRFRSSENKAHTSQCSCETLHAWRLAPTVIPLEQVICGPRTKMEVTRSAEDFLCSEVNCFEPATTKYCSIQVLNNTDNSTKLSCIFNRSESGYENATWLSSALALAAECRKIKGVQLENVGSFPLNKFTSWSSNNRGPQNEYISPYSSFSEKIRLFHKLDFLEVRGISKAVFANASSHFTKCCKRISIQDVTQISFKQESDEEHLEVDSLASTFGRAVRQRKLGVRLEFLNLDNNNKAQRMRASCCQNFSIERNYTLTKLALQTLIEDCLGHCGTEDVACVEKLAEPSVQQMERKTNNNSLDTSYAHCWICSFLQSKSGGAAIMGKSTFVLGPDPPLEEVIFQSNARTLILQNGALSNIAASKFTFQGISDLQLEDNALQTPASNRSKVNIRILNSTVTKFQSVFGVKPELVDKQSVSDNKLVKRSLVLRNVDLKAPLPTLHLLRNLENFTVNFSSIASLVAEMQPAEVHPNSYGDEYKPSSSTFGHLTILNSDIKVIETNAVRLDHVEVLAIVNSSIGLLMKNGIEIGDLQMLRLQNTSLSQVESRALRANVSENVVLSNNILRLSGIMPFEIMFGKKTNSESVDKLELGDGNCSCTSMIHDPEGSSEPEGRNLTLTPGFLTIEFECKSTNGTMIPAYEYQSTKCVEAVGQNPYILMTTLLILVPIIMVIAGVTWIHHKRRRERKSSGHVQILQVHTGNPSSASTVAAPRLLPDSSVTGTGLVPASASNQNMRVTNRPIFENSEDDGEYIELPPRIIRSEPSRGPIPNKETDHISQAEGWNEPIFAEIGCRRDKNPDGKPDAEIVENVYSEPFEGMDRASASKW